MEEEKNILDKAEAFFDECGFNLFELIQVLGKSKSSLLSLNNVYLSEFQVIYNKICQTGLKKDEKGKLLEELTYILLKKGYSALFECAKNCRTSTNELDLQINWTENAKLAGVYNAFPFFGDSFICECKNYVDKVSVTYVGKFYSLLKMSDSKLGILITWDGISKRGPWSDSLGLIKKIALKEGIYIIPIDKNDLKQIATDKTHIFEIINSKYIALKNDIDYSKFISKHENEDKFIKEARE